MKNIKIINELNRIASSNGGLLVPEKVVDAARNPRSVLHSRFEWDDGKAADEYRIWQARQLISVCVETIPGSTEETQAFVSLSVDRHEGRGYRKTVAVLNDAELREQLLRDALSELNCFQQKYSRLRQLADVFSAIRKVRKKAA